MPSSFLSDWTKNYTFYEWNFVDPLTIDLGKDQFNLKLCASIELPRDSLPQSVAVTRDKIFVSDMGNNVIQFFQQQKYQGN